MPPKVKPLTEEEEDALFDAPLFPDSANENADADKSLEGVDPDDPALFDAPLFPKDVYDPERSPSPPAWEPKNWWDEILGKANEVVSTDEGRAGGWRAALQGASQNTADNLTRWASPSFADSLDQAAKDYPRTHGLGQAYTGIAAGAAAGPGIVAQGLTQGGLSAMSEAADGGGFWPTVFTGAAGAAMGAGGTMVGNVAGKAARALGGTEAGKWAGRQLGRLMPAADDSLEAIAAQGAKKRAAAAAAEAAEMPRLPRHALPDEALQAPSGPPPSTAPGEDEQALIELLQRKRPRAPVAEPPPPTAPYPPAPSAAPPALPEYPPPTNNPPPGTWPPDFAYRSVVKGKGGRFAKRVPMDFPIEEQVPGYDVGVKATRARGVNPPEPPPTYERPTLPSNQTLSEPPLPMEPAPPQRRYFDPEGPQLEPAAPSTPAEPWHRNFNDPAAIPKPVDLVGPPPGVAPPRTMFHDLHDTMKFSPSYRKAVGAVKLADRAMNMAGGQETNLAAQAGRAGFELAQETGLPGLFDQKVNAQDYAQERPAVADLPTLHYALQATLASGRAGLSPEDEQALTEAVVQGDQAAISATDFRLRQRYPAYARRVERELRAYNEEN